MARSRKRSGAALPGPSLAACLKCRHLEIVGNTVVVALHKNNPWINNSTEKSIKLSIQLVCVVCACGISSCKFFWCLRFVFVLSFVQNLLSICRGG